MIFWMAFQNDSLSHLQVTSPKTGGHNTEIPGSSKTPAE